MLLEKFLKWNFLTLLIIWGITYSNQVPKASYMTGSIIGKTPVGGKIIDLNNLCTLPVPHTSFSTASPGAGSGQWNWVYGKTFPFNYGPINSPSDLGKDTLGLAGNQYMPCMKKTFWGPQHIWHGGMNCHYTGKSLGNGVASAATGGGGSILKGAMIGSATIGGYYLWKKHNEKKEKL